MGESKLQEELLGCIFAKKIIRDTVFKKTMKPEKRTKLRKPTSSVKPQGIALFALLSLFENRRIIHKEQLDFFVQQLESMNVRMKFDQGLDVMGIIQRFSTKQPEKNNYFMKCSGGWSITQFGKDFLNRGFKDERQRIDEDSRITHILYEMVAPPLSGANARQPIVFPKAAL